MGLPTDFDVYGDMVVETWPADEGFGWAANWGFVLDGAFDVVTGTSPTRAEAKVAGRSAAYEFARSGVASLSAAMLAVQQAVFTRNEELDAASRAARREAGRSGSATKRGCERDTDGDGNCDIHRCGCPPARPKCGICSNPNCDNPNGKH